MENKAKQYIFTLLFIIIVAFSFYFFILNKKVLLSVETYLPNTQIIINREKSVINSEDNETIRIPLKKGDYEIIVAKEGYFPWTNNVVLENKDMTLKPFMVAQYPSGQIITENDPEYLDIRNKILNDKIPTENNPRISDDKSTTVWVSNGNEIFSKTNDKNNLVIKSEIPVRNVYFYKGRNNVILFSTRQGVYVIDIYESYGVRNFMPVYTGTNTYFMVGEEKDFIYIKDTNSLMTVMI